MGIKYSSLPNGWLKNYPLLLVVTFNVGPTQFWESALLFTSQTPTGTPPSRDEMCPVTAAVSYHASPRFISVLAIMTPRSRTVHATQSTDTV